MPNQRPPRSNQARPRTPLREVRLGNFKSVRDASVELRPLTAIVGRNSSGKSTLLQGILALAQAVRRDVVTGTFPLNGDFVRLGTFEEVRNFDAGTEAGISIGFTVEFDYRPWGVLRDSERRPDNGEVKWEAHLVALEKDAGSGRAEIETIEFQVNSVVGDEQVANVVLTVNQIVGPAPDANPRERQMGSIGRGGVETEIVGRVIDMKSGQSSKVEVMTMTGGLPIRIFRRDTRFNVKFRLWWEIVEKKLEEERRIARQQTAGGLNDDSTREATSQRLVKDVDWAVKFAQDCLLSDDQIDRDSPSGRRLLQARRVSLHIADSFRFEQSIDQLSPEDRLRLANAAIDLDYRGFHERLYKAFGKSKVAWRDEMIRDEPTTDVHQVLEPATTETYGLFQNVHYLGPLRAKPQVMYSPGGGQTDIGPEGEFTATYLNAHSEDRSEVPLPDGTTRRMSLGSALNLWLEELGLVDRAAAKDLGRLGMGLYVQPVNREQRVDLTSVGVGVSQALPVVLLCLLARPGSIVLIEQPELHLHPAMQLKLADFLLACSRAGRQIVIETHSEHIINRLRLRVAADETSETADIVRLLFAEQENGETRYRISDINEVGGLSVDWPKGFLDVAADESTRLLQQSLAKKRARAEKKS